MAEVGGQVGAQTRHNRAEVHGAHDGTRIKAHGHHLLSLGTRQKACKTTPPLEKCIHRGNMS